MTDAPDRLDLRRHQEAVVDWRRQQFPNATIAGTLLHLRGEIEELAAALERRGDPESADPTHGIGAELADCLNMLCSLAGFADVDLEEAAQAKWKIVRERVYSTATVAAADESNTALRPPPEGTHYWMGPSRRVYGGSGRGLPWFAKRTNTTRKETDEPYPHS